MSQCIHCEKNISGSYLDAALHTMSCKKNPNYKLNQLFQNGKAEKELEHVAVEDPFVKEIESLPENEIEVAILRIAKAKQTTDPDFIHRIRTLLENMEKFDVK